MKEDGHSPEGANFYNVASFFAYYRPYKGLFILDFSCAIAAALLELVFPLAVNRVVDDMLPSGNWKWILYSCLGLLGIYIVSAFMHFVVTYWGHKLGINIESDMRKSCLIVYRSSLSTSSIIIKQAIWSHG